MDENQELPRSNSDRSQATAEKLRALREKTTDGIQQYQKRIEEVEAEVGRRINDLATDFENNSPSQDAFDEQQAVIQRYEEQIAEIQERTLGLKEKLTEQLGNREAEVAGLQDQLAEQTSLAADRDHAFEDLQKQRDELREQLDEQISESLADASKHEEERSAWQQREQALEEQLQQNEGERDQQLIELRKKLEEVEASATSAAGERDDAAAQLSAVANELEEAQAQLAEVSSGRDQLRQELDQQRGAYAELEAKPCDACEQARDELEQIRTALAKSEQTAGEVEQARDNLQARVDALDEEVAELKGAAAAAEENCDRLVAELAESQRQAEELQTDRATSDQLQQQIESLQEELRGAQETTAAAAASRDELSGELDQLRQQFAELQADRTSDDELSSVQQKFDLALADVHNLKAENADLRQQLESRPEASEQDSAELVALRTQRDELTMQVEQLQSQAVAAGADAGGDMADLQRRFELAVEDVRQLKREKAELEEKIASRPAVVGGPAPAGNDWQAQKARLLAQLDGESDEGDISPQRQTERATVQETIAATDQAVAAKNRKIEELAARLEELENSRQQEPSPEEAVEQQKMELLDADEMVQQERQKLVALQDEWSEKVRTAELELSVERAKLARERAAMETRLEAVADQQDQASDPGRPRRRWLAALGLREGEEGDAEDE